MKKIICDVCGKEITTELIPQIVFQEISQSDGRPTSHEQRMDVCMSCQGRINDYITKIRKI